MKITIGSRGSNLALTQSNMVRDLILESYPDWEIDIKIIKTHGDKVLDKPISQIGGKEIFVKEIEKELLDGTIDMAVHSMKDMPGDLAPGLKLSFVPKREDSRDVLIMKYVSSLEDLPNAARIGTGSKRRAYQIKEIRPDFEIVPIRGNVETRIKKMETEDLDGVILASAGIHRLGLSPDKMIYLDHEIMLPSPTQGILAIEIAESNKVLDDYLMKLNDEKSHIQAKMERGYLRSVGGSCTVPVGAYAKVDGDRVTLYGMLGDEDGNLVKDQISGTKDHDLGYELGERLKNHLAGKVYLVGAGPGDPELITVKGRRTLLEADTIVYDRLANPNLLNLNPHAKKIYVGKKAGDHYRTQDQTNEILYQEAKEGKIVVRLKGGDPYVFGRGGEEALYLKERGIKLETVPGITSPIGGLAYSGIPITHRGLSTSFHVITGHTKDDDELNYKELAGLDGTLVFLMGFGNLDKISQGLIDHGKDPQTPVAIIQWATSSRQKVLVGDLSNIYEKVENSDIGTPAMIAVGEVVSLREDLNFYEEMPLFGHNIVITREAKRAQSTIDKFQRLGANVISFPMIETVFTDSKELDQSIANIEDYDYIYFTSVNGVNFFMEKFLDVSDIRKLSQAKFCTVGIKTYRALENYGIKAELMPELFEGMEAVEVLKEHVFKDDKVLVPRAKLGRNEIVEELKKYCQVDEVQIYDTVLTDTGKEDIIETLSNYEDYELIFTSSSTFNNLSKVLGQDLDQILSKAKIVSIGPITSQAIEDKGYEVDLEAREYTIDGIIEVIKEDHD